MLWLVASKFTAPITTARRLQSTVEMSWSGLIIVGMAIAVIFLTVFVRLGLRVLRAIGYEVKVQAIAPRDEADASEASGDSTIQLVDAEAEDLFAGSSDSDREQPAPQPVEARRRRAPKEAPVKPPHREEVPECPIHGKMILRTARKGGQFYGCTHYFKVPRCRYCVGYKEWNMKGLKPSSLMSLSRGASTSPAATTSLPNTESGA